MVTVTELQDARIDSNREVFVNAEGDLATTSGTDTVLQSVGISVSNEIRGLLGQPMNATTLGQIESRIQQAIAADPQAIDPLRVQVTEVDKQRNAVSVVAVTAEEDFELTIDI